MNKQTNWLGVFYGGLLIGIGVAGIMLSNSEYKIPISIFSIIAGLFYWILSIGEK